MHILEIPSFFIPYGGEFCLDQAKALSRQGHEIRILSNVQLAMTIGLRDYLCLPWTQRTSLRDGIPVIQRFQRGVPKTVQWNMERWIAIVRTMFHGYVAQYGRPDVIHAHCAKWAGYAAMLISHDYGIPYVITEHLPKEILETEFREPLSDCWQLPLLRQAYQEAAMVITVSDELVQDLACYYGTDYRHLTIHNIIDVDFFACQARKPRADRPFVFCCPAVFVARKGYDVLLAAFGKLLKSGEDVRLVVAGQGTQREAFRNLVARSDCADRLSCLGALDREGIRQMLYDSDALVLATRGESQGLVLLEAMSTGIPAISTEGIPRSVRLDGGYRYVPVNDVDALAEEMRKALHDPQPDGRILASQVRDFASPEVIGRQIAAVLSDVVSAARA